MNSAIAMDSKQKSVSHKNEPTFNFVSDVTSKEHVKPAGVISIPKDDDRFKPYTKALFSTSAEYKSPMDCEVSGSIPDWINGSFVRVGPGRYEWGETRVKHAFDGDALAHAFNLSNGKVTYRSQFLETKYHHLNEKYNRVSTSGFGTWTPPDPCASFFKRMFLYFFPNAENDNANVNVVNIQGHAVASTETPWMADIDPHTVETIKRVNAGNQLNSVSRQWLAHPHYDADGNYYIFSTKLRPPFSYQLVRIPNNNLTDLFYGEETIIELPWVDKLPSYYHSFFMSENYVILLENPYGIDSFFKVMTMNLTKKPFLDILKWRPENGLVFRIICRKTLTELRRVKADAAFVFHTVNAYEKNNELILDVCAYPDSSIVYALSIENLDKGWAGQTYSQPNLYRYRIPLDEIKKTTEECYILDKKHLGKDFEVLAPLAEFPIINYEMVNGKEYKYMYAVSGFGQVDLVKVNVQTKERVYWKAPKGCSASEPFFVATPNAKSEDDGVVLSTVTGCIDAKSFLVVINAKTFKEIGRAVMPVRMASMLHSSFWPNTKSVEQS